jgi:hypothetical protein
LGLRLLGACKAAVFSGTVRTATANMVKKDSVRDAELEKDISFRVLSAHMMAPAKLF